MNGLARNIAYKKLIENEIYLKEMPWHKTGKYRFIFYAEKTFFDLRLRNLQEITIDEYEYFSEAKFKKHLDVKNKKRIEPNIIGDFNSIPKNIIELAKNIKDKAINIFRKMKKKEMILKISKSNNILHYYQPLGWYVSTKNIDPKIGVLLRSPKSAKETLITAVCELGLNIECYQTNIDLKNQLENIVLNCNRSIDNIKKGRFLRLQGGTYTECIFFLNDLFYFTRVLNEKVEVVKTWKSNNVWSSLVENYSRLGESRWVSFPKKLQNSIYKAADSRNNLNLFKKGLITIGGGASSAVMWTLKKTNIGYLQHTSNNIDTSIKIVNPRSAISIFKNERYSWSKYNEAMNYIDDVESKKIIENLETHHTAGDVD